MRNPHTPARRALTPNPPATTRQGEEPDPPVDPGSSPVRARFIGLAIGILAASSAFALAEAIHFAGLNPFEPPAAMTAPAPPTPVMDGSGMGKAK